MGLEHLPPQTRHNDRGYAAIFNSTWGHYAPEKNTSYKGVVRFTMTDHSHYGCQPIIIQCTACQNILYAIKSFYQMYEKEV